MAPKVSLLVCTLGRTSELGRMFLSLQTQTFRDFEIIVVDQNADERLALILRQFEDQLPILHLRSERGLSRGRNIGLKNVRGEIVAFPDDDCEYPPTLLAEIVESFDEMPEVAGICGRHVDVEGQDVLARFEHKRGYISTLNVWRRSSSATIFLRKMVTEDVGPFDEQLGAGSGTPWGAAEESDYLCRTIEAGYKLLYDPALLVLHPRPPTDNSPAGRERAAYYGRGMGFVLRKHEYPLWFTAYMIGRPAGGAIIDVLRWRIDAARLRWRVACARAAGYMRRRGRHTDGPGRETKESPDRT